ncbi:Cornifin domain-containing protein [Abeliophyllum distichum]|uniref:Cornifin domain-containing protein n=1 Tax=Abeliophyllum distichum TaxID=126358 RepID=A0ABD1Q2Y7_9LAMI
MQKSLFKNQVQILAESQNQSSGLTKYKSKGRKIIELPAPKRPEEAGQVDHPKYCRFHQIISHPVERCFVLKDIIVRLDKENKIKLETDENPTASYSMVSFGSFDPIPISNEEQTFFTPYDAGKSLSEVAEFGPQLSK